MATNKSENPFGMYECFLSLHIFLTIQKYLISINCMQHLQPDGACANVHAHASGACTDVTHLSSVQYLPRGKENSLSVIFLPLRPWKCDDIPHRQAKRVGATTICLCQIEQRSTFGNFSYRNRCNLLRWSHVYWRSTRSELLDFITWLTIMEWPKLLEIACNNG